MHYFTYITCNKLLQTLFSISEVILALKRQKSGKTQTIYFY